MQFQLLVLLFLDAYAFVMAMVQRVEECQQSVDDELIWEYDVRRPHRSGVHQEVEADYGPMKVKITCIKINSLLDEDNDIALITSGGIGYNFVKLKFRSKYSRGLRYRVFVYGQPILTIVPATLMIIPRNF